MSDINLHICEKSSLGVRIAPDPCDACERAKAADAFFAKFTILEPTTTPPAADAGGREEEHEADNLMAVVGLLANHLHETEEAGGDLNYQNEIQRAMRWLESRAESFTLREKRSQGADSLASRPSSGEDSARLTVQGLASLTDSFARRYYGTRQGVMLTREMACAVLIELQDKLAAARAAEGSAND